MIERHTDTVSGTRQCGYTSGKHSALELGSEVGEAACEQHTLDKRRRNCLVKLRAIHVLSEPLPVESLNVDCHPSSNKLQSRTSTNGHILGCCQTIPVANLARWPFPCKRGCCNSAHGAFNHIPANCLRDWSLQQKIQRMRVPRTWFSFTCAFARILVCLCHCMHSLLEKVDCPMQAKDMFLLTSRKSRLLARIQHSTAAVNTDLLFAHERLHISVSDGVLKAIENHKVAWHRLKFNSVWDFLTFPQFCNEFHPRLPRQSLETQHTHQSP